MATLGCALPLLIGLGALQPDNPAISREADISHVERDKLRAAEGTREAK